MALGYRASASLSSPMQDKDQLFLSSASHLFLKTNLDFKGEYDLLQLSTCFQSLNSDQSMTVVDESIGRTTSSQVLHHNSHGNHRSHRKYPSIPSIKDLENRGQLSHLPTGVNNSTVSPIDHNSLKHVHHKVTADTTSNSYQNGIEPSIISSIQISPKSVPTRRPSKTFTRKSRKFMTNVKEIHRKYLYPVNAPKRRRSRYGKYRSSFELSATMNYISQDTTIEKDLCINQVAQAYELPLNQIIKIDPRLIGISKAITLDSHNNIILYTPNSTGKNSIITNAEERLDKELQKLSLESPCKNKKIKLPEYKIPRPYFNRYDTAPLTQYPSLLRTQSLPTKFKDEAVEALWNLYLRRVLCGRITWRLTHSNSSQQPVDSSDTARSPSKLILRTPNQRDGANFAPTSTFYSGGSQDRVTSGSSSVDTRFFVNATLQDGSLLPPKNSTSDELLLSAHFDAYSDEDVNEPLTNDEVRSNNSVISDPVIPVSHGTGTPSSPSRQAILSSLEQLMDDASSLASNFTTPPN